MISRMIGTDQSAASQAESSMGRRARVLIVEDELIIAWELGEMLAELGYEVCGMAADTAEALRLALETAPDLVIMDVRLRHGDDGIAAAEAIRAQQPVPILFSTAYAEDPTMRARMQAANAACILSKPIGPEAMRSAVAEALATGPG
jgi:CheY-like chemotaxis protein